MLAFDPIRRRLRAILRVPLDAERFRLPLLDLLGLHGPELALHSLRTAVSLCACRDLCPGEPDPHLLTAAGLLHDVGKLLLPPELLLVARRYTPEESARVRRHPVFGLRLLPSAVQEPIVLDAISHHHERWNGKGYPLGLEARRIPAVARLLAVVDAFDAMTHPRPYRPVLGRDEALAELRAHAGTQFDPGLVDGFCDFIEASPTPEPIAP